LSTETTIRCDRCGDEIVSDRTLLRVEYGSLRSHRESIDLCAECVEALAGSLRHTRNAPPEPDHEIEIELRA
jgi:hypothetical protein